MQTRVRVMRRLGDCAVGDVLALELDGRVFEGVIRFIARAPQGGFLLTVTAETGTWELYAVHGACRVVSQLAHEPHEAAWHFETTATVADSRTGRRFGGAL
jgi:hypothetical protein